MPAPITLIEPDGSATEVPQEPGLAEQAAALAAAEEMARVKAEAEAKRLAEEEAARQAEEKERVEVEEQARLAAEAEEKKRKAAEEKAKKEAEAKAQKEAEAKAEAEAAAKAKREAEERAQKEAEEKARLKAEAEEKARKEAEAKAKKEAEEQAKREAAAKAKKEAEEKAKREAEEKAKRAAEAKAKKEAEAKAKREAEERARKEAEEQARLKAEAEEKARKEAEARREAEAKAKREAEEKAKKEAEAKAKKAAEEKAKKEAEAAALAAAKAEEERKAKQAAEAAAKAEADKLAAQKAAEAAAVQDKAVAVEKAQNLGETFRRLIRETGPISLAHYMAESNARYYASRDPLGEEGDFITAPEVSQMFGELIGLWIADLWVKMGSSDNIHLVELGPGRGTLMTDILRTSARYGFNPQLHFVETSIELRKIQRKAFPQVQFHNDLSTLPEDRPLLIVANEFFDALPIHQLVRSAQGWHERMVGLEDDKLVFVAGDKPMDAIVPPSWKSASQGTMIETSAASSSVMKEIATRLTNQGGAALIIDYGSFELRAGSTLQALKDHTKVDPLEAPGMADLTAHVDFELLGQIAEKTGAEVMGLQMQGEWLRQMGIDTRTEALQRKNPAEADKVQRQRDRLVEDGEMGVLFKVLGVCGRRWPIGHGFD